MTTCRRHFPNSELGRHHLLLYIFVFFFLSFFEGGVRRGPIKNGSKYACLAPRISPPPVCVCKCVRVCLLLLAMKMALKIRNKKFICPGMGGIKRLLLNRI